MAPGTIVVVEDEFHTAKHLESVLVRAGYEVPGIASSPDVALELVAEHRPDLVLLDIGLRGASGLDLGKELTARGVRFLYVSGRTDLDTLDSAPSTEPAGYVVKPFTDAQLLAAVKVGLAMGTSQRRQDRDMLAKIANVLVEGGIVAPAPLTPARQLPELSTLSTREWEVLRELLAHRRTPAIARKLHISPATVRNHLKSIFAKVGVHSQQELLERIVAP
jgi:DNA-binding NarL/FixJ family response regulator